MYNGLAINKCKLSRKNQEWNRSGSEPWLFARSLHTSTEVRERSRSQRKTSVMILDSLVTNLILLLPKLLKRIY